MNCLRCQTPMIKMGGDFICPKCGFKTPANINESNSSRMQSMNDSDSSKSNNKIRM